MDVVVVQVAVESPLKQDGFLQDDGQAVSEILQFDVRDVNAVQIVVIHLVKRG